MGEAHFAARELVQRASREKVADVSGDVVGLLIASAFGGSRL